MGYTGDDDPLASVELRFPDLHSATAYAERQGLTYRVQCQGHRTASQGGIYDTVIEETVRTRMEMAWMRVKHDPTGADRAVDFHRAVINPSAVFASPEDVLHHPRLDTHEKRQILTQWAWDEHLLEIASDEAMPGGNPSRLVDVKAALARLNECAGQTLVMVRNPRLGGSPSAA